MRVRSGVVLAVTAAALGPAFAHTSPAGADWAPLHSYRGAVPVLAYHGIHAVTDPSRDPYSVSPAQFASHMTMLSQAGFHAISIAQYAAFAAGNVAALPDRPVLITFDDGLVDSYLGADQILARLGMRATMFVITENARRTKAGLPELAKLGAMAAGGHWDLQEHAHAGHVLIPTGPRGRTGPYYANLLYRDGARETFTAFKRRVSYGHPHRSATDGRADPRLRAACLRTALRQLRPARRQLRTIAAWERSWLARTFKVFFIQDRRVYNLPGNVIGQRYGITPSTTAAGRSTNGSHGRCRRAPGRPPRPRRRLDRLVRSGRGCSS